MLMVENMIYRIQWNIDNIFKLRMKPNPTLESSKHGVHFSQFGPINIHTRSNIRIIIKPTQANDNGL
jgi:hypothetical protein